MPQHQEPQGHRCEDCVDDDEEELQHQISEHDAHRRVLLDATERGYSVIVDRREAIRVAIAMARPEDTVAIAGKGHEDYQIVGREKLPFSDPEEARRALRLREAR